MHRGVSGPSPAVARGHWPPTGVGHLAVSPPGREQGREGFPGGRVSPGASRGGHTWPTPRCPFLTASPEGARPFHLQQRAGQEEALRGSPSRGAVAVLHSELALGKFPRFLSSRRPSDSTELWISGASKSPLNAFFRIAFIVFLRPAAEFPAPGFQGDEAEGRKFQLFLSWHCLFLTSLLKLRARGFSKRK